MDTSLLIGYLNLRRAVGALGLLLPALLMATAGQAPSLSDYYHTGARDLWVGAMCTIGVMLFFYNGYDRGDRVCSAIAGAAAVAVALVPVGGTTNAAHIAAACLFFAASAALCVRFGFGGYLPTVFNGLAAVMVLACAASFALPANLLELESVASSAFGAAWLLKGKVIAIARPAAAG